MYTMYGYHGPVNRRHPHDRPGGIGTVLHISFPERFCLINRQAVRNDPGKLAFTTACWIECGYELSGVSSSGSATTHAVHLGALSTRLDQLAAPASLHRPAWLLERADRTGNVPFAQHTGSRK